MSKTFSFDIVSEFDQSEMNNAVDQTAREIQTRYDFQGTGSKISYDKEKQAIEIESNSELKLETIIDVLESKFIKRGLNLKHLDKTTEAIQSGMAYKKTLNLVQGLDQEKAKKITKVIRDKYPKVKTQIQGEEVRVMSGSKDDLQEVITLLKSSELDMPLNFTNFR
jgi:uncharacterized protein YajQ (UPF0234 family)